MIDLPESSQDSFFQVRTYVTLKVKAAQPSSPMSHSVEIQSVLDTDGTYNKTIQLIVSDVALIIESILARSSWL